MLCWMNGEYVDSNELCISPFDHGFLYGLGFFETFRTYKGQVPFFEAHMKRLRETLAMYRIVLPHTDEALREVVANLDEASGDGYFRLNVSAGVHDIGLQPSAYAEPTVIVFRKPLVERPRGKAKELVALKTPRNTAEGAIRVKSHHYGNNVLARFELPNLADFEGLFYTEQGYLAEGITSNVFWVHDRVLYTPALETGILNGITRQVVMRLAGELGVEVQEGLYTVEHLLAADECFCTNAVQELVPISHFGDKQFERALYEQLHAAYVKEIEG